MTTKPPNMLMFPTIKIKLAIVLTLVFLLQCKKEIKPKIEDTKATACFTIIGHPYTGDTISVVNCSQNAVSFAWNFGDGLHSGENAPKHTYAKAGTYQVMLIVRNDNNIDSASSFVHIVPENHIYAGKTDTATMFYFDFDPDNEIIETQTSCKHFSGSVSFDINEDTKNDITLTYAMSNDINCQCFTGSDGDCFGSYSLYRDLIVTNENMEICADSMNNITPFRYGDTIGKSSAWSNVRSLILYNGYGPAGKEQGYWGWGVGKDDTFIGFRYFSNTDTCYGWIRVNAEKTMIAKDCAFSK